jgi:hypothetical protein
MTALCQECTSYLFVLGNPLASGQLEPRSMVAAAVCLLTKTTLPEAKQTRREVEMKQTSGEVYQSQWTTSFDFNWNHTKQRD